MLTIQCSIWSATFSNTKNIRDVISSHGDCQIFVSLIDICCEEQSSLGLWHMAPVSSGLGLADASGARWCYAALVQIANLRNFIFHSIKINVAIVGVFSDVDITTVSFAFQFELKFCSFGTAARMSPHPDSNWTYWHPLNLNGLKFRFNISNFVILREKSLKIIKIIEDLSKKDKDYDI